MVTFVKGAWRQPNKFIDRNIEIMSEMYVAEIKKQIQWLFDAEMMLHPLRETNEEMVKFVTDLLETRRIELENELKKPKDV